jgi:hypothetical protein
MVPRLHHPSRHRVFCYLCYVPVAAARHNHLVDGKKWFMASNVDKVPVRRATATAAPTLHLSSSGLARATKQARSMSNFSSGDIMPKYVGEPNRMASACFIFWMYRFTLSSAMEQRSSLDSRQAQHAVHLRIC